MSGDALVIMGLLFLILAKVEKNTSWSVIWNVLSIVVGLTGVIALAAARANP